MTMLRISERTKVALRSLAEERGQPMSRVVEELVEVARTERFFKAADAAYQHLRSEPGTWAAELTERAAWETTVADGLGDAQ
jgi:hypothetical protein